jgi:hypothetical protein
LKRHSFHFGLDLHQVWTGKSEDNLKYKNLPKFKF